MGNYTGLKGGVKQATAINENRKKRKTREGKKAPGTGKF